jgi:hypothetical protein
MDASTRLALFPQHDDFLWEMFHRGAKDAAAWAAREGFPAEVLARLQQGAADTPLLKVVRRPAGEQQQQQPAQQPDSRPLGHRQDSQRRKQDDALAAATAGVREVRQLQS